MCLIVIHCNHSIRKSQAPFLEIMACVTDAGAGEDSVWEQKKLEARQMLVNCVESPASSARFVGRLAYQNDG